jgi:enoyl-CoA hydratase
MDNSTQELLTPIKSEINISNMDFNNLTYSVEEGICTITVNRPDKLNALNQETINEIRTAFDAAEDDDEVKGIILTGAGPKAFVAGADIAEFAEFTPNQAKKMAENGHRTFDTIEHCHKPVIAAVNGFALGGGCEMAMSCHIRIAAENAKFGQPEINLGVIPGYGGTQRLVRLVGFSKATELLLTGDMVGAQEAKELRIVSKVVPQEELMTFCREMLLKISKKSPLVIAQILKLVNQYYESEQPGFISEISEFADCFNTEDFKEGVGAFLNKRKPEFSGR